MLDLAAAAAATLLAIVILFTMRSPVVVASHVLVLIVFSSGSLKPLGPVRYSYALVLLALVAALVVQRQRRSDPWDRKNPLAPIFLVALGLLAVSFFAFASPLSPGDNDAAFRYSVLFPLSFFMGYLIRSADGVGTFGRIFVGWSVAFSILAVAESAIGTPLFGREDFTRSLLRDGVQRAVLGSEHPLVLAAIFAAAVPFALSLRLAPTRRAIIVALIGLGLLSTVSRGGLIVFLAVTVGWFVFGRQGASRRFRNDFVRFGRVTRTLAVALGLICTALLAATLAPATVSVSSTVATAASAEYRLVLYRFVLDSLAQHPLGWGVGGLPQGIYVAQSAFGPKDLAVTIDSELALLGFDFGWIGVALFLFVLLWAVSPRVLAQPSGLAAAAILWSGLYLALHSWTGLPVLLLALVGMTRPVVASSIADDGPPTIALSAPRYGPTPGRKQR